MPSIYELKPAFQRQLRPLVAWLARGGVSANAVTVAAVLLSAAGGAWLLSDPESRLALAAVPVILVARMALNAIDGMLAREHGMQTPLGAVLNELGDVVSDAILYLPLALVAGVPTMLQVVAVVLGIIAEMTGVVAVQIGASRRYDGPMGKSDRALAFGLLALLLALGVAQGWPAALLLGIVIALLVVTIGNRARAALKEVRA